MANVSKVLINYQENPVGIRTLEQVRWILESQERNTVQSLYELQIGEDAAFQKLVYCSGIIRGDNPVHDFQGNKKLSLSSSAKYFVRVRVKARGQENSDWKGAFFVTALLTNKEWQAQFITIERDEDKEESRSTYVRKEIQLKKEIRRAYAYTTALGLYHFYLNGSKAGKDELAPGWTSYNKHLLYQTYDVTDLLNKGINTAGAFLGAGWYKGTMGFARMRNHYGKKTAFACQLEVEYEDGEKEIFLTDETWQGTYGPVLFSEIYDGELYDARMETEGWNKNGCDTSRWLAVTLVPFSKVPLTPQSGCPIRQITELPAKRIFQTPQGDMVADFGQNLTGWIQFKLQGNAGDKVRLRCFEVLDAEGNVYLDNLRSAKQTVTYICKDDQEVCFHPFFTFQGFQYARVEAFPGEVKACDLTAFAVHSQMRQTGTFECSSPDLNQLWHNILWGMKGNFLDVPTDCPQRDERLGWTGDAQIFCRTASYLMDTYTFYRKWLRDLREDQTKEGGVPHVVPDILSGKCKEDRLLKDGEHSAAAWADAAVIVPFTLYLIYGDKQILREQYKSMKGWIEFMRAHSVNHIWNYHLQFGDWVALDAQEGSYFGATPNDLTCTAYYAYSTGLFARAAMALGRREDARKYEALHKEIADAYQNTFFDSEGRLLVKTQTAHIISLYFGLVPDQYREQTAADLVDLLKKEKGHLVTGFVGTPYFCHALSQNGYTSEAYGLLLNKDFPSWLYQVRQGATTIWEHWDGKKPDGTMWSPDMNSFNHYAYGAVGEWMYRAALGIECDEKNPGWGHFIIGPHISGNLEFMKGSYDSVRGLIRSCWQREGNKVTFDFCIPSNTCASVRLYGAGEILDAGGLLFTVFEEGRQAEAGSGTYQVAYELEERDGEIG